MVRSLGLSAIFAILASPGFAQYDSVPQPEKPTGRHATHYIGIQANQLVKQLLNLGGSTSAVNNPYLITYSVNANATGVGLNLSLGVVINEFSGGDNFSTINTKINEFFFRIGIEKKTRLGKRWVLAAGGDLVIDNQSNKTETIFSGSGSSSTTEDKISAYGTGVRAGLNFEISNRVLVGTEANYYLKFVTNSTSSQQQFGSPVKESTDQKKLQLNVPAVLFL